MYMQSEKIIMADGREIIIGDIPYYVKDGILYVFMSIGNGHVYIPMGKVKEA